MPMFNRSKESGAVSLFVVVFAMLFVTIVTISFLRLMLSDQQQATTNDLSQSAYDSSLAGVEDAKRALILYRTICAADENSSACREARAVINDENCNQGLREVVTVPSDSSKNTEIPVQQDQSGTDGELNQAYTCVLMQLETDDYLGTVTANTSKLIPLKSTAPFTEVLVEWYTGDDLGTTSKTVNLVPDATAESNKSLYAQSDWPGNRPSLLRAQLMQFDKESFSLDSFDNSSATSSNANTVFLYPSGQTNVERVIQDVRNIGLEDNRKQPTGEPVPVKCSGNISKGGYACSVRLQLPSPIDGSSVDRMGYLRLTGLYNSTHFRVSLVGTQFDGVQPIVDSTGRANDLYRRVENRVDLIDTNFPFPEAALDLTGNLCKDFAVTDQASDYSATCTP